MNKNITLLIALILFGQYSFCQKLNKKSSNDIVFQTGFEEGDKSIWDDYDGNPDTENQIISDPGPFNDDTGNNHVSTFLPPRARQEVLIWLRCCSPSMTACMFAGTLNTGKGLISMIKTMQAGCSQVTGSIWVDRITAPMEMIMPSAQLNIVRNPMRHQSTPIIVGCIRIVQTQKVPAGAMSFPASAMMDRPIAPKNNIENLPYLRS